MYAPSNHLADFYVAGMRFWDGALALPKLKLGGKVKLVAEPDNPHDPEAVAIYKKGLKLGYVPRDENHFVSLLLNQGHGDLLEARVAALDPTEAPWRQVFVTIALKAGHKNKGSKGHRGCGSKEHGCGHGHGGHHHGSHGHKHNGHGRG